MELPATVKVRLGAQVFSPDGVRPWGSTNDLGAAAKEPMTIVKQLGDKYLVDAPRWPANGKQWTVYTYEVTPVTVEPPTTDPPTGAAFPDEIIVRVGTETKSYDPRA